MFPVLELTDDVRRVTLPLPTPPGHVHAYLLRADDGWTLVDAGLGLPDLEAELRALVAGLDAPVVRIVITHMHPDHVGGAAPAAAATGAEVWQGALDHEQCERVWGDPDWPRRVADWFAAHGTPEAVTRDLLERGPLYASFIRFARDVHPLREGDAVAGWRVVELPGHADGHIGLLRGGRLVAGDHLLPGISPAVGVYPESRPDPLGAYLGSLRRTIELGPSLAYPGHGDPIADPAARARELLEHHAGRRDATGRALADGAATGYEVSLALFPDTVEPGARRFAVAEALSHLERLAALGRAARRGHGRVVSYTPC
ncbi:MAG: MBL fold metallo-hydrolase [Thermoleophilia bacterium]|nr:MBL fold metallo-hydrolase [Thermoleophilia bacterium]